MSDLVPDDLRAAVPTTRRQSKARHERTGTGISLVHVGFLLAGLMLGVGLLLGGGALVKWRAALDERKHQAQQAAAPEQTKARRPGAPAPVTTPATAPKYRANSPDEAVRVMLKASIAGDAQTVYGLWEIGPDEIAAVFSGQQLTLAEITARMRQPGRTTALDEYQFRVARQGDDQATVFQEKSGRVLEQYSVHRTDAGWKIRFLSLP